MAGNPFPDSPYDIRSDLLSAHEAALACIARPGTWLAGEQRVWIAEEVRNARNCPACAELKEALSPDNLSVEHTSLGNLSPAQVDIVHRVVTDPGRLSEGWCRGHIDDGMLEGEFVEMIGVIAVTMIMDTFAFGLGLPVAVLPEPAAGEPSRYLPPGARREAAWLPIVEPGDEVPEDGPLYPTPTAGYIQRALSMVPQSKRDYWDLAGAHYLEGGQVYDFGNSARAISRPQIEIIAARISALHQCLY